MSRRSLSRTHTHTHTHEDVHVAHVSIPHTHTHTHTHTRGCACRAGLYPSLFLSLSLKSVASKTCLSRRSVLFSCSDSLSIACGSKAYIHKPIDLELDIHIRINLEFDLHMPIDLELGFSRRCVVFSCSRLLLSTWS